MKPCVCNTPGCPTGPCHFCKLYESDERYRRLWSGEQQEPSLIDKAVSFAKSAVRHAAAGLPSVTPAEQDRRMALCLECDQYNAVKQSCRKCGCRMKLKTSWALEKCPLDKW